MNELKKWFAVKKERLIEGYDRTPEPILRITEILIKWAKVFFLFVAEIRVDAFWLRGEGGNGGKQRILYIGKAEALKPVLHLIGHRNTRVVGRRALYCWELPKFLRDPHIGSDCVVFRANILLRRFVLHKDYVRLASSVKSHIDLSESRKDVENEIHPSVKRRNRNLCEAEYTLRVIPGEEGLCRFYHDMYVPYAERRFGRDAKIESIQKVRRLLRNGFLAVSEREGQWLSAAVVRIRSGVFVFELVGNLNGDLKYTYDGTMESLYLFFFQLARARNCKGIDLGISPPFLKSGLVFYKNKWGATLLDNPKERREICIRLNRPEKFQFLEQFPIVKDHGGLLGLTYIENEGAETKGPITNIIKIYRKAGLRGLWLYTPNGLIKNRT